MSDLGTFSIRVVDEDGDGVGNARVSVHWAALLAGPAEKGYTDSDGWVELDIRSGAPWGSLVDTVYVNDEEVGGGFTPEDGDTFSFTLP